MAEDLQKLMARRQEIENLQATLQGVIMQSGKKIDVDELKSRIVDGVKKGMNGKSTNQDVSNSMGSMGGMKENTSKRMNRSSRSKSPGHSLIGGGNGTSFDEVPERGSAVKFE